MSEAISTNPADRALNFIDGFIKHTNSAGNRDRRVRNTLASMHNLKSGDTSSLMITLSDAWKLPVQIRQNIGQIGLDPQAFEYVIERLERVLMTMTLESSAHSVKNSIPAELSPGLIMISSMLNKDLPEALLTREKIDDLLEQLSNFDEEIRAAELDKDFTDYILHRADSIRYALNHYETLGPNEVITRVDQMFGGVLRQYQHLTNTKKKSGLISKLLKIGASIIFAINAFNGSFELSDNISKFIDSGIQIEAELISNEDSPKNSTNSDQN